MRTIFVAFPNGSQAQYNEDYLRVLVQQGKIPQNAMYWVTGMAEWRPITEICPPYAVQAPMPPTANAANPYMAQQSYTQPTLYQPTYQQPAYGAPVGQTSVAYGAVPVQHQPVRFFVKDPAKLTRTLVILLLILAILNGGSLLAEIGSAIALSAPGATALIYQPYAVVTGIIGIIYLIALIVTVVHFCKWVHRANTNVRGFGAQGLEFTPEWAVGWYFVPFLNLVRPYQAMQEIWKASQSPGRWTAESVPWLLGVWWGLYLVSNIVSNVTSSMSLNASGVSELQSAAIAAAGSYALDIAAVIVAIAVVRKIVQLQTDYVAYRS